MKSIAFQRKAAPKGYWPAIEEVLLLVFVLAAATLVAYEYQAFSSSPNTTAHDHTIDLAEVLVLTELLFLGLLVLCWRILFLQRREVRWRIEAEKHARDLAHQDILTSLPNRRQFDEALATLLGAADGETIHAVLALDLNGFKRVNDVYGHSAGDEVLVQVGRRLREAIHADNLVARFGGDEFAIITPRLTRAEEAAVIAQRVIEALKLPITVQSVRHQIGVGIGIAVIPTDGESSAEIMRKADIALYRAKAEADSAFRFFEADMDQHLRERDFLERDLRTAITGIEPHYQPLIDLESGQVAGFEALARWNHPTLGDVPPDRFIPIAESCGLIDALSDHLLEQAAYTACQWPDPVYLSFNISAVQLKDSALGARILSIIGDVGLSARRLEIEITGSVLSQDMGSVQLVLEALRQAGVRVALDDFGSGYSNLYRLQHLQVDRIKIDRSLIDDMGATQDTSLLVRGLTNLSRGLGLEVTVGGIERPEQAVGLLENGCRQGQGFLFGRAMPAAKAIAFVNGEPGAT